MEGHVPHPEIEPIDVRFRGLDRVICCWRVGDVLVDPGPESSLPTLLEALGDARPRALLLTHIHLDHAGATGALVRRWPDLEVYVHERGAPHLIDPSKLLASAGAPLRRGQHAGPVGRGAAGAARRASTCWAAARRLADRRRSFSVAYTPGHASHHVCYLHEDSGRAFVGDMAGVRIPPAHVTLAPTPPPDIDVEAWDASLDLIAAWEPSSLALTHFGAVDEVEEQLEATRATLHEFAELTRNAGPATVGAAVRDRVDRAGDRFLRTAYGAAVPAEHIYLGLERYWRKRAEREATVQSA